jgi:hyperosmotically inducible periplasmic protein
MTNTRFATPATRAVRACAGALALVALVGCSSTQPPATQLDDTKIKAEVMARIAADPDTNPFEIEVAVNEGVVHLTGVVDEPGDREEAARLAASASGVVRVVNDIKVGDQTLGERVDDGMITARVKAKIAASSQLNPFDVQVNTVDGEVSLTGRVHSQADKDEAERLARETDGVRAVRNLLEVGDIS